MYSSTIIDHVLASHPERATHQEIIEIGLSGHQQVFCARKIYRVKRGTQKHIKLRLFKHCITVAEDTPTNITFSNYQNFSNTTEANDNFIQQIMVWVDKVAPIKERKLIPRTGLMVTLI